MKELTIVSVQPWTGVGWANPYMVPTSGFLGGGLGGALVARAVLATIALASRGAAGAVTLWKTKS